LGAILRGTGLPKADLSGTSYYVVSDIEDGVWPIQFVVAKRLHAAKHNPDLIVDPRKTTCSSPAIERVQCQGRRSGDVDQEPHCITSPRRLRRLKAELLSC
jgi:hypothetical protein